MSKQPDTLFREKLENFSLPAPSTAWSRVEQSLGKKKNNRIWLRAAASFLLLAVAGGAWWFFQKPDSSTLAVNGAPHASPTASGPVVKPESTAEVKTPVTVTDTPGRISHQQQKTKTTKKKIVAQPIAEPLPLTERQKPESIVTENSIATQEPLITHVEEPVARDEGITLVFSAEEVHAKYLNKNPKEEATAEDKRPSTLRKLLNKAYDLKNNQDPLGELRQKKNEILALNFKTEKQRSQNR